MPTKQDSTNSCSSVQLSELARAEMLLEIAIGKQREADIAREVAEAAFRELGQPVPPLLQLMTEGKGH